MATLVPDPKLIELEGLTSERDSVTVRLRSTQSVAACPGCSHRSKRVHSFYFRHLADLPWLGVASRLLLRVKKFFCDHGPCSRRIFTERLAEVVRPYGRRTLRLERILSHIGFASGGEGAARVSRELNAAVSADTLLRAIRTPMPTEETAPRVLGIDEFAFRKGHRYGTILVDLEKRKVIDLLPDRSAETVASWLKAHPQLEIISRDRSGAYADAASRGAPQARQVADRWHLLKNLSEALSLLVARNSKMLKEAGQPKENAMESATETNGPANPTRAQVQAATRRERRLERYNEIIRLRSTRVTIREIARRVGVARRTVRRFLTAEAFPERAPRKSLPSILDPFKAYLQERWHAGCHNASQLHREIAKRGYTGCATTLRRFLAKRRKGLKPYRGNHQQSPEAPSAREVLFLMTRETIEENHQSYLKRLFELSPQLELASSLARQFIRMVKNRQADHLEDWLEAVGKSDIPDLESLAKGLRQDQNALRAALELEWSNGQVEGQINRLKTIKRQMYGRAKFDLLRQRVLRQAS